MRGEEKPYDLQTQASSCAADLSGNPAGLGNNESGCDSTSVNAPVNEGFADCTEDKFDPGLLTNTNLLIAFSPRVSDGVLLNLWKSGASGR